MQFLNYARAVTFDSAVSTFERRGDCSPTPSTTQLVLSVKADPEHLLQHMGACALIQQRTLCMQPCVMKVLFRSLHNHHLCVDPNPEHGSLLLMNSSLLFKTNIYK